MTHCSQASKLQAVIADPLPPNVQCWQLGREIFLGDRLPAQALIMGTRLPNIEYGGQGAEHQNAWLCFCVFLILLPMYGHIGRPRFLIGFIQYGAPVCLC